MADAAQRVEKLARELHALHTERGLLKSEWSFFRLTLPEVGFLHDSTLKPKLKSEIVNKVLKDLPGPHIVIGYLWDWWFDAGYIAFTDTALFVTSSQNSERFRLSYDMLASATLTAEKNRKERVVVTAVSGTRYVLDSGICNLAEVCTFLQKAIALHEKWQVGPAAGPPPGTPRWDGLLGTTVGLESVAHAQAATNSAQSHTQNIHPVQPHGFWAEKGNHLFDKIAGKDTRVVGSDNAKYGADRCVDGLFLQSKYYKDASKSVGACFDGKGNYKYQNPDGSAMKVEVPKDQYDAAVKLMAKRIEGGRVPGMTDPKQAKELVQAGHITYNQALMLAKAGTIESITYDTVNGINVAGAAFGLSSILSFAVALWNGKSVEDALSDALITGLKVGVTALGSSVLSGQLGRTALDGSLRIGTDWLVKQLSETTVENLASVLAGKALSGDAAVNALSKLLRGNFIAATATVVVLSAADIRRIFEGGISGMQFFKNVTRASSGVAGGMAGAQGGALGGAALGTAIFPGPGTAIGGIIGGLGGGLGGGFVVQWATDFVLNNLIEDDAAAMLKILEDALMELAQLYLLGSDEAEQVMQGLSRLNMPARLRAMHAAGDRKNYGRQMLEPLIERIVRQRRRVAPPSREQVLRGTLAFIESTTSHPNDRSMATALASCSKL